MATPTVPHQPRPLAAYLSEHQLPGARSMTAIERVRRQRRHNPAPCRDEAQQPTLQDRLYEKILREATAEIASRGGETSIEGRNGRSTLLKVTDRDPGSATALLRAEGWRYYSSRFGSRHARLAYLYGRDDAGPWAVRVPGTLATVADALAWVEPLEVARSRAAGCRVQRQGDVYAIETTPAGDGKGADVLPAAHEWRPSTRYLVHRPEDGRRHRPIKVDYPVQFVRQRVLAMGRGGGRACGD